MQVLRLKIEWSGWKTKECLMELNASDRVKILNETLTIGSGGPFFLKINIVSFIKDQEQSSYNTGQAPKYP
jgi:hypothetical protein